MNRKRILIFRPDNIGDVVLFSGALKHIRSLYPDDHLSLAVQPHILNLVELCPFVDACVPVDLLTWWEKFPVLRQQPLGLFARGTRELNRGWNSAFKPFDKIIYPVRSPQVKHLQIIHELNAKSVIGFAGCRTNEPQTGYPPYLHPKALFENFLDVSDQDPWRHELLISMDFLRFLGTEINSTEEIKPEFWLSEEDPDSLAEMKGRKGRRIIGLFPGASRQGRCWAAANYAELAHQLGNECTYVIFGSSSDLEIAAQVESSLRKAGSDSIVNLVGKTTLRALVKSIYSCDLFLGMETSGLHIAIASGIPTIGIVGGGHFGRFVPWGKETNILLTNRLECFRCNWRCNAEFFDCIQKVTPLEVANAASVLLK